MNTSMLRTRWAAIGAAVAVTLGAGGLATTYATSPAGAVAFVPITACRLADTRPAPDNVGPRSTPIGAGETLTIAAHGNNGDCTGIPTGATGLSLNVTAIGATNGTFLTIWANGVPQPSASSLNPQPGAPPIPNAVTTGVSSGGEFNIFNGFGSVNVIVDVVGYYTDHTHTSADITNEAGVSSDFRATSLGLTGSAVAVVSTALRAPSDGYVTVDVTGNWRNDGVGEDRALCQIQKGAAVNPDFNLPAFELNDRNAATVAWTGFSAHRTLEISAADNPLLPTLGQSLSLVCRQSSGEISLDNINITATFHPTSYKPLGFVFVPFGTEGVSTGAGAE